MNPTVKQQCPMTEDQLRLLAASGNAPTAEQLAHLAHCPSCMQRYCDCLQDSALLTPPPTMKKQILAAARSGGTTARRGLVWYWHPAVQLTASIAAALVLWCSGVFQTLPAVNQQLGQWTDSLSATHWQTKQQMQSDRLERRFNQEVAAFEKKQTLPFFWNGGMNHDQK